MYGFKSVVALPGVAQSLGSVTPMSPENVLRSVVDTDLDERLIVRR